MLRDHCDAAPKHPAALRPTSLFMPRTSKLSNSMTIKGHCKDLLSFESEIGKGLRFKEELFAVKSVSTYSFQGVITNVYKMCEYCVKECYEFNCNFFF